MKLKDILQEARDKRYGIGHFNFSNTEILKGIVGASEKLNAPVFLGTSEGERNYYGLAQAVAYVKTLRDHEKLPIFLNADHTKSVEEAYKAVDAGYDSIHIDLSDRPFDENMELTKKVIHYAKSRSSDIIVEGELGYLKGSSKILDEKIEIKEDDLTKPDEAEEFVRQTGVDILAIVVGNLHGVKGRDMKNPHLYIDRINEIKKAVDCFLVLHGGSGTPDEDVVKAIQAGINILHVNTEIRIAYRDALQKALRDNPNETTPYKLMPSVIDSVQKVVEGKIKLIGEKEKH